MLPIDRQKVGVGFGAIRQLCRWSPPLSSPARFATGNRGLVGRFPAFRPLGRENGLQDGAALRHVLALGRVIGPWNGSALRIALRRSTCCPSGQPLLFDRLQNDHGGNLCSTCCPSGQPLLQRAMAFTHFAIDCGFHLLPFRPAVVIRIAGASGG